MSFGPLVPSMMVRITYRAAKAQRVRRDICLVVWGWGRQIGDGLVVPELLLRG